MQLMSLLSNLHSQLFQDTFPLARSNYAVCFAFHSLTFSQQEDTETKDTKLLNNSHFINTQFIKTLCHAQKTRACETGRGK